jgi:hypothetical protein
LISRELVERRCVRFVLVGGNMTHLGVNRIVVADRRGRGRSAVGGAP